MNESQADTPPTPSPSAGHLDDALRLVEFLRARCPWDAAQTPLTLRRYLLEETHEVVDAINQGDDHALADELGDLLLNLAFQIVIGEERGVFDRATVVDGLKAKMRRRHPHLYGDGPQESWEAIKAAERGEAVEGDPSILRDIFPEPDGLAYAHRIQAKAASVGFDWPDARGALAKVREEIGEVEAELPWKVNPSMASSGKTTGMPAEAPGSADADAVADPAGTDAVGEADPIRLEEELGDLLFAVVNLARLSGVHASTALARANAKFTRRFRQIEARAADRGMAMETAGLEALDEIWNEIKREEG